MDWVSAGALMMGALLGLMAIGIPIALAFLATNILGVLLFMGYKAGMPQLVANASEAVSVFSLVPVPMFLIMGGLLFHTGLAVRVFDALDKLIGRVPGRLSYLTVAGGTMFAALSGSSMANTGMMGTLMVPEMLKRGYKRHMALGPVLGSGGLAVIIPPSSLAVLLGSLARIDVGALLIAGFVPGLMLAALYVALIWGQIKLDPSAAPQYPVPRASAREKLRAVVVNILPMSLVVFMVVGFIVIGIATPSESAAFGAVAVLILAILYRCLTWKAMWKSLEDAFRVTAMSFILIVGSSTFAQLLAYTGAAKGMVEWATGFQLAPLVLLLCMFAVLLVLGMFMDQLSMMLITLPIFIPLAIALKFDLVWFGLIVLLGLEIGFTTPPFGLLLFVMLGVAPKGTTLMQVAGAALPYIGCHFILIALLIAFPGIVTFLPQLMK